MSIDNSIRDQFPILRRNVNGKPLIYFDNAATTQKPQCVIDAISQFYSTHNSNIHRSAHTLAVESTTLYETTRESITQFINAAHSRQIVFTRGTTESINLVMYAWAQHTISKGDEILISGMEHHSNMVPWQFICNQKNATLKIIPVTPNGTIDIEAYEKLLSPKTKLVACTYISNSLGTVNPIKDIITKAHHVNARVLVDAAQAVAHTAIDVQQLNCDFLVFSAHKMYGTTGVGFLYAKENILHEMQPFHYGGEMIKQVTYNTSTYADLPFKFEAGTPNIADVVACNAAITFINNIGLSTIHKHEQTILTYATERCAEIEGLKIVGNASNKAPIISFTLNNAHTYDIAVLLDKMGIAVRSGHHCCMPLMQHLHLESGTCRASFALYNTTSEIDAWIDALDRVQRML